MTESDMAESFYKKNLGSLKKIFPAIFLQVAECSLQLANGVKVVEDEVGFVDLLTTSVNGTVTALYGERNPVVESQDIFEVLNVNAHDYVFFMGMGLGYHALTAIRRFSEKPSLVVFEPSLDLFILSLHYLDLTPLLTYPYLDLYVGLESDFRQDVQKYSSSLMFGEAQLLSCFPPLPFYNSAYESGYIFLQEWLKSRQESRVTLEQSSLKIFQNTIENLPSLLAGQSLGRLRGVLKDLPAFCVAAGPSLDSALDDLKKVGDQGVIVALDSAVQALVGAGIKPHVVVTADFKEINFEKLRNVLGETRDSVLIFALGANVMNVSAFLGQRRIGVSPPVDLLQKWICRYLEIDCQVPSITSVGQTALFTAASLGLGPIVLVGMDLAFPEGLDHATNTVFRSSPHPDTILFAAGVAGRAVSSQSALIADKVQIEKVINEIDNRVVNTGMQGVLLKGTEVRSLVEMVECELDAQVDVTKVLNAVDWESPVAISDIIHLYQVMLYDLMKFSQDCESGQKRVEDFFNAQSLDSEVSSLAKKVSEFFAEFQSRWADLGNLLSAARFKELQGVKCRRIKLDRGGSALAANEAMVAEIEISRDDLDSLFDAARLFAELLQPQLSYYQGLHQLPSTGVVGEEEAEALLTSAAAHLQGKQYWQAEYDYRSLMAGQQNHLAAICGLADMYCDLGLWQVFQSFLQTLEQDYPDIGEIKVYQERLKQKISEMLGEIKRAWQEGEKEPTRRIMMAYLKLVPDDQEIMVLRDVINELDEEEAGEVANDIKEAGRQKLSGSQLLRKAQSFIDAGDAEPAIGILEGLSRNNNEKSLFCREKIGDIRLHQKDLRSACWHYSAVFDDDILLMNMQRKIAMLG